MASLTDPARELGEVAARLMTGSNESGDRFLAREFGVERWSTEFMKVVTCILERADLVARIISASDLDEDHKESALDHIRGFKSGFVGDALRKPWHDAGHGITLMKDHGGPIKFLSPTVRPVVSYPRLNDEEIAELIEAIDVYLEEVRANEDEPAFVRQAIIDGLTAFRFQLERIGWMGAGYALSAFREILIIYDMSGREIRHPGDLDAGAFLSGLWGIITSFKEKADAAKGWRDAAEMARDGYMLASSVAMPFLLTGNLPALPAG